MPARLMDYVMDFGPFLPLTMTQGSKNKPARLLGLVAFFLWVMPAMAVVLLPLMALMLSAIVVDTRKGEE